MKQRQLEIQQLLTSLHSEFSEELIPASKERITDFQLRAKTHGVDDEVIEQLSDLYSISDNYSYEIIMSFHPCDDAVIFEWWEDKVLWLGQRDFNTLRWANGKFCLGDAGDISYSPENEYNNLLDLIQGCIEEIKEIDY